MSGSISDSLSNVNSPWLTYEKIITTLNPGDLIEITRGTYSHWVMYHKQDMDDNYWCYHVTQFNDVAKIMYETLFNILGRSKEAMCRVNNQDVNAQKKNVKVRKSLQTTFDELASSAEKSQSVHYTVEEFNCEYYSTKWRYGVGWTMQPLSTAMSFTAGLALFGVGVVAVGHLISSLLTKGDDKKHDND